jgi:hypothetical protein
VRIIKDLGVWSIRIGVDWRGYKKRVFGGKELKFVDERRDI